MRIDELIRSEVAICLVMSQNGIDILRLHAKVAGHAIDESVVKIALRNISSRD